jgi:lipid II:glycine glycyltransferase (peptidoglycan interpeptide bridge formation enzyme)
MKYEFRQLEDLELWNGFLENFPTLQDGVPRVTFVQSYEWILFQRSLGNQCFPFAWFDSGGNIVAVAASILIKAKRGSYLYVRNGPVLDWNDKVLLDQCIDDLKSEAKKLGAWFVRLSPLIEGETNIKLENAVDDPMHDVEALDTWMIDVRKSEDELLSTTKKKHRYEIRKSIQPEPDGAGLESEIRTDVEAIDIFYEILSDTVRRQGWNAYSKEYIQKEFEAFSKGNKASIIFAKKNGKYIAGGVFIHFANQTFYHYGASLSAYNKIPGPYRVIWEAIRLTKEKGLTYVNLWGVSPEDKPKHPWFGLSRFKRKFPGFEQKWAHSKDLPLSPFYWLTNLYDRIDKTRKGY